MHPEPDNHRRRAAAIGALFLIAAATSIVALALYQPVLGDDGYVTGGDAHRTTIAFAALLEIFLVLSVAGTALTFYPALRRQNRTLALSYVAGRLLEGAIIAVGIVAVLSVVTLHERFADAADAAADSGAYDVAAQALVAVHDWTFLLGPNVVLGPNTLILGFLLFRTGLVPRPIATLGLIGGPVVFLGGVGVLFGAFDQVSAWGTLAALPVFCFEMSLAAWLLAKGFRKDAPAAWGE